MINKLIENYIKNMNINDVIEFARNNNIVLSNDEAIILFKVIKKDWYTIIYGDYKSVFNCIKQELKPNTYKKAEELFFYFKNKYQKFL